MSSHAMRFRRDPVPAPSAFEGIHVGELMAIETDGRPRVRFAGGPADGVVARVATADRAPANIGSSNGWPVLLTFERGDAMQPIIVGFVRETLPPRSLLDEVTVATDRVRSIELNGRAVIFQADEEIVLRCGLGSLTIRANGQIVVKGTRLVSRASETNKIRGAAVEIN